MGLKEAIAQVKGIHPDIKLIDLDNPEQTTIHVDVRCDARMAGAGMVAHLTAQALANLGYKNVEVHALQNHSLMMEHAQHSVGLFDPRPEERDALSRVKVVVTDTVPEAEKCRLQPVVPNTDIFPMRVEDLNFDNPCAVLGRTGKRMDVPFELLMNLMDAALAYNANSSLSPIEPKGIDYHTLIQLYSQQR